MNLEMLGADAMGFIESHPELSVLLPFDVRYSSREILPGYLDFEIHVFKDGQRVASAEFTKQDRYLYSQNIAVEPAFQRQGIATALYVFVERFFGLTLSPFWEPHEQTEAARKLWALPNRPFGPKRKQT